MRDFALNVLSLEGERNVAVGLRTTDRACRCWGIWKSSARNRCWCFANVQDKNKCPPMFVLPEQLLLCCWRWSYNVLPQYWQTPCCTHTLSSRSSIMWVWSWSQGVSCGWGKAGSWAGWLLCGGVVCLTMCLTCSVGLLGWSCHSLWSSGCLKYCGVSNNYLSVR